MLAQDAAIAMVVSILLVIARRLGGRRALWIGSVAAVLVLVTAAFWHWPNPEGPNWLTAVGLSIPVLAMAGAIHVSAARAARFGSQVAIASLVGLAASLAAAFAAYVVYASL